MVALCVCGFDDDWLVGGSWFTCQSLKKITYKQGPENGLKISTFLLSVAYSNLVPLFNEQTQSSPKTCPKSIDQ